MKNCPFCGRSLRLISFWEKPIYEECDCERRAREQAIRDNEEACKRIAAQKAACHHEWQYNIMDNVGVRFCHKCGALEQA